MTKIVYNACYGGFGLSDEAILRYAELKGIAVYPEKVHFFTMYWTVPNGKDNDSCLREYDIERDDPILVQVVEELGEKANGRYAKLQIEEIEAGTLYRIDEYDGNESIMTQAEHSWRIA